MTAEHKVRANRFIAATAGLGLFLQSCGGINPLTVENPTPTPHQPTSQTTETPVSVFHRILKRDVPLNQDIHDFQSELGKHFLVKNDPLFWMDVNGLNLENYNNGGIFKYTLMEGTQYYDKGDQISFYDFGHADSAGYASISGNYVSLRRDYNLQGQLTLESIGIVIDQAGHIRKAPFELNDNYLSFDQLEALAPQIYKDSPTEWKKDLKNQVIQAVVNDGKYTTTYTMWSTGEVFKLIEINKQTPLIF